MEYLLSDGSEDRDKMVGAVLLLKLLLEASYSIQSESCLSSCPSLLINA
jgi:hypothetical protein